MPTIRVRVPLEIFDALVRLADALPGGTSAERGEQLAALVEVYRQSISAGREYRPPGGAIESNTN